MDRATFLPFRKESGKDDLFLRILGITRIRSIRSCREISLRRVNVHLVQELLSLGRHERAQEDASYPN